MKSDKTSKLSRAIRSSKPSLPKRKVPPDPDGYFKFMASRAKKVINLYKKLNDGAEHDELVWFLLIDLMHLCDQDQTLGVFEDACIKTYSIYESLVEESEFMMS